MPTPDGLLQSRLTGPAPALDRRTSAIRGDIVDIGLAACVSASRYVTPMAATCEIPQVAMRAAPDLGAVAVSELLFGEAFDVFEDVGGWSWGRTRHDHYLGWVPSGAVGVADAVPDLRVSARRAPVFAAPDIKAPVVNVLPFGARLPGDGGDRFVGVAGGFVHRRHVAPVIDRARSPLETARQFDGAPYVWGGRTPDGVDCSGLVQAALNVCGHPCPRDTDQQLAAVGTAVDFDMRDAGDLVYFPGHVGILTSRDRLFHANAFWMSTIEEPLADVIARLAGAGVAQPVLGIKRLAAA